MRRAWFRADDGTYYRNVPLVLADMRNPLNYLLPWRLAFLEAEYRKVWRAGTITADAIGRRDWVARPAPFRDAYPGNPGLWVLDEETPR